MRVIELVFLMGTQCVSPIQHTPAATEVAKVECAVVIEKDTEAKTVRVSPQSAVSNPRVAAAMQLPATPEPASAPPEPLQSLPNDKAGTVKLDDPPQLKEARAVPDVPPSVPAADDAAAPSADAGQAAAPEEPAPPETADAAPEPDQQVASAAPDTPDDVAPATEPPRKSKAKRAAAKAKASRAADTSSSVCGPGRKPVWYTSSPGHRKYRCRSGSYAVAKNTDRAPSASSSRAPAKKSTVRKPKRSLY